MSQGISIKNDWASAFGLFLRTIRSVAAVNVFKTFTSVSVQIKYVLDFSLWALTSVLTSMHLHTTSKVNLPFTFSFLFLFLQNFHQNAVLGVRFSLFNLFTGSADSTACFLDYEDADGEGSVTTVTKPATTERSQRKDVESSNHGESYSNPELFRSVDSPSIAQTSSEAESPVDPSKEDLSSDAELETWMVSQMQLTRYCNWRKKNFWK